MKRLTTRELALCSLFAALIAIGAFLQIPLPNFDYFTLQFFFVLMAGMLLGARLGAMSASLYVLTGLLGIPVFAAGGGISYVLRPSFGFLLGFIVTAYSSGWIMEHGQRNWRTCFLAALAGLLATYGIGLVYKYMLLNYYTGTGISFYLLLLSCFPLDLPGDILFSILAACAALRFPAAVLRGRERSLYAERIQK
ncbi:biotin transporter BioY [[Clostridium] innocuum]|nr:biotin transporter BioY [[Clostridium] innocuum]